MGACANSAADLATIPRKGAIPAPLNRANFNDFGNSKAKCAEPVLNILRSHRAGALGTKGPA